MANDIDNQLARVRSGQDAQERQLAARANASATGQSALQGLTSGFASSFDPAAFKQSMAERGGGNAAAGMTAQPGEGAALAASSGGLGLNTGVGSIGMNGASFASTIGQGVDKLAAGGAANAAKVHGLGDAKAGAWSALAAALSNGKNHASQVLEKIF